MISKPSEACVTYFIKGGSDRIEIEDEKRKNAYRGHKLSPDDHFFYKAGQSYVHKDWC